MTIRRQTPVCQASEPKVLYQGRWVQLLDIAYLLNGEELHRHLLKEAGSGNGTYIVAITPDGCIVFIKQYRAGHEFQVEFPAGRPDPMEDAGLSALKELLEETGYQAKTALLLGMGPVLTGTTLQITFFYLTMITGEAKQQLQVYADPADQIFNEGFIQTFLVPLEKAEDFIIGLLQTGSGDPKMLAALRLAINHLQRSPIEYVKFWLKIWQNRAVNWLKNKLPPANAGQ